MELIRKKIDRLKNGSLCICELVPDTNWNKMDYALCVVYEGGFYDTGCIEATEIPLETWDITEYVTDFRYLGKEIDFISEQRELMNNWYIDEGDIN